MQHRTSVAVAAASLALILAACSGDLSQPGVQGADGPSLSTLRVAGPEQVVPGEIIVKLKRGADMAAVARGRGLAVGGQGYRGAFSVFKGASGSERSHAAALSRDPRVVYAEPNYLRQPTSVNPKLWAFYNPGGLNMKYSSGAKKGQTLAAGNASLTDADEDAAPTGSAGTYAAGGSDVVIGSIDTGVDMDHPEFTGRLIAGRDWYNSDGDPNDDEGHGTHTTGTMAGSTVGVAGVSGAAAHVRVYVQKVCGRRGCPTTAIVNAIRAAADYPGLVAMNLSLGGASESQAERDAISYATGKNVLVIASAGNDGTGTVSCPACDVNALSVAATTWRDTLASYSNYGSGIDISAPGGLCYSNTSAEGCIYSAYLNGGYEWLQGTSMAAPQVTGAAAIVASATGLRGSGLRGRLLSTADDKGANGYDTVFGNGRLNSYRAVTGKALASGQ